MQNWSKVHSKPFCFVFQTKKLSGMSITYIPGSPNSFKAPAIWRRMRWWTTLRLTSTTKTTPVKATNRVTPRSPTTTPEMKSILEMNLSENHKIQFCLNLIFDLNNSKKVFSFKWSQWKWNCCNLSQKLKKNNSKIRAFIIIFIERIEILKTLFYSFTFLSILYITKQNINKWK